MNVLSTKEQHMYEHSENGCLLEKRKHEKEFNMPLAHHSFFSGIFARFGEDKSLNLAKALAELVAEKLAIPIGNSKRFTEARVLVERVLGKQLAEAGGDGLTVLAKTLIHMPQRWNQYIAAFTGFPVSEVTVVTNQFLDELAKGIIKHHGANPSAAIAENAITAKGAIAQAASEASVVEQLTAMERMMRQEFVLDLETGLIHSHGCSLIFEFVRDKDASAPKDGKKGPPPTKKVKKSSMQDVTLSQILELGRDPNKKCEKCCVQVMMPVQTASNPTPLVECVNSLDNEALRRTALDGISRISLARATLDELDFIEFVDYVQRPIWTLKNATPMIEMWKPLNYLTATACLNAALSTMRLVATPKERPKPPKPSKIDKVAGIVWEATVAYAKGEGSPHIDAVHARADQFTTESKTRQTELRRKRLEISEAIRQGK